MDSDAVFRTLNNISAGTASATRNGAGAAKSISSELKGIGSISDSTAKYLGIAGAALGISVGTAVAVRTLTAVMQARRAKDLALSAALTAANANPFGWWKIALATGAAAVAGAAIATIMIKGETVDVGSFDLSTTIGRENAVNSAIGGT